jgi:hypothetical protein
VNQAAAFPRSKSAVIVGALLLWPAAAHASDMAILAFAFSLPVCLGLVALCFVLAELLKPALAPLLGFPIAALAGIQLYMLPEMVHTDEQIALGIQAAVSATSLLALRNMLRRGAAGLEQRA